MSGFMFCSGVIGVLEDAVVNRLTPNDPYMGRTAPLTSKRCILYKYIYSTNIGTEYFKRAHYSPFFSLHNAVYFIMLTCLVPVLFTFHIQGVLKFKENNSGAKGLISELNNTVCLYNYLLNTVPLSWAHAEGHEFDSRWCHWNLSLT